MMENESINPTPSKIIHSEIESTVEYTQIIVITDINATQKNPMYERILIHM